MVAATAMGIQGMVGLRALAREALEESDGDRTRALLLLGTRIREDRALYERFVDPLIDDALDDAIGGALREERRPFRNNDMVRSDNTVGLTALGAFHARTLLDFPLPGSGLPLGDATHGELDLAIATYRPTIRTMTIDSRWLAGIIERLPEGKTVRQQFTHEALHSMRASVEQAYDA